MRLGILGPCQGDLPALAHAAQHLLDEARVERVIYLSEDDALEKIVFSWARDLVGGDPTEDALYDRAAARCATATAAEIDDFVAHERARLRLKVFVSLPRGRSRSLEILDGRVVLFVYDKAMLDEEDISAASLFVFGKSAASVIKKVGARTFLSPGPIGSDTGGSALLDDTGGGLRLEIINGSGVVTARDSIGPARASGKMKVQGE
jgi:hypothetical protein